MLCRQVQGLVYTFVLVLYQGIGPLAWSGCIVINCLEMLTRKITHQLVYFWLLLHSPWRNDFSKQIGSDIDYIITFVQIAYTITTANPRIPGVLLLRYRGYQYRV